MRTTLNKNIFLISQYFLARFLLDRLLLHQSRFIDKACFVLLQSWWMFTYKYNLLIINLIDNIILWSIFWRLIINATMLRLIAVDHIRCHNLPSIHILYISLRITNRNIFLDFALRLTFIWLKYLIILCVCLLGYPFLNRILHTFFMLTLSGKSFSFEGLRVCSIHVICLIFVDGLWFLWVLRDKFRIWVIKNTCINLIWWVSFLRSYYNNSRFVN